MSWASIAGAPPPHPTPSQRMNSLRKFFSKQLKRSILLNALGFTDIPGTNDRIAPLMEHAVVIGVDTEAWTRNTDMMTEIGLAVFERRDMVEVQKTKEGYGGVMGKGGAYEHLGHFGEELLKKIRFHHLRIVETAHLRTNAEWMKGAEGNRFGYSRFVTFAEARAVLDELFNQPILSSDPDLQGCKKPIILMGHAMHHDEENFKRHGGLQYDWFKHNTIVAEIDTQPLAKMTHTWLNRDAPGNDVGLDTLTKKLGFEHEDPHTACNDAARTVISGIQMVLPRQCKEGKKKDMQTVAWELEEHSRDTFVSSWGTELCCTRCGGRDHQDKEGERCEIPVYCKACAHFDKGGDEEHWRAHVEEYCMHIAEYKGWIRRRDDAIRKRNPIPPGPPEGSHPPSAPTLPTTFRCKTSDAVAVASSSSSADITSDGSSTSSNISIVNLIPITSSSNGTGTFTPTLIESTSEGTSLAPTAAAARIVTFQSAGRGRSGHSIHGGAAARGGSVLSRDWRHKDDW